MPLRWEEKRCFFFSSLRHGRSQRVASEAKETVMNDLEISFLGGRIATLVHKKQPPKPDESMICFRALTEPEVTDFLDERFGPYALCRYVNDVLWWAADRELLEQFVIRAMEQHAASCRRCQIVSMTRRQREMLDLPFMRNLWDVARTANTLFRLTRLGNLDAKYILERWLGDRPTGEEAHNAPFSWVLNTAISMDVPEITSDLNEIRKKFGSVIDEDAGRRVGVTILVEYRGSLAELGLELTP